MNKKEVLSTLLGIMIGGIGVGSCIPIIVYNIENYNIEKNYNFLLRSVIAYTIMGSFFGGTLGWTCCYLLCNNNEENLQSDPIYREFFESQRIENNSIQLVSETTPLLQEHIININSEENLPNPNISSTHSRYNIL